MYCEGLGIPTEAYQGISLPQVTCHEQCCQPGFPDKQVSRHSKYNIHYHKPTETISLLNTSICLRHALSIKQRRPNIVSLNRSAGMLSCRSGALLAPRFSLSLCGSAFAFTRSSLFALCPSCSLLSFPFRSSLFVFLLYFRSSLKSILHLAHSFLLSLFP